MKKERIFVWIYDVYILVIISLLVLLFGFNNPKIDLFLDFLFIPLIAFIIIISFANIYFTYHYDKEQEAKHWRTWGLISILFGVFPYALIFIPIQYFLKLRPYWTGKTKSVY